MKNLEQAKSCSQLANKIGLGLLASIISLSASATGSYYDRERDVMVPRGATGTATISIFAPESDKESATITDHQLIIRNHRLAAGSSKIEVNHGDRVSLLIEAEHANILHLDGYDLNVNLPAGEPVLLSFIAERPGKFFYRLANHGRPIGVLQVAPPDVSMSQ